MASPLSIRPACPTLEEGQHFARYSNQAAHGLVRTMFGPRFERILATAYMSRGHDMSHETVMFAERDNVIVGMASGYTHEQHRHASMSPIARAAGIRFLRLVSIGILGARLFSFIDEVPEGDYYLAALAVGESQRGSGVGTVLLDAVEDRAREHGCGRLALDVATSNGGALRLYERRGMAIEAESPAVMFMPEHRMYRMVKAV